MADPDSGSTRDDTTGYSARAPFDETRRIDTDAVMAREPLMRGLALSIGDRLGRYVLLRELGAGGMSVVFVAYDPELDRRVALKLMRPLPGTDRTEAEQRLLREAQALARLSHSNVVHVYDVGVYEGHVYMAMELVEGETLRAWLKKERRPWRDVLNVLGRAAEGLSAAHAADLVHLDFKPSNVVVGPEDRGLPERVRVVDFGLARPPRRLSVDSVDPRPESKDSGDKLAGTSDRLQNPLTEIGAILGTPGYMSPEQHRGANADAKSDQFSFCVTLWEALYEQRPFVAETRDLLQRAVMMGRITEPDSERGVPKWVHKILRKGLSVRRSNRYPDIRALLNALRSDPSRLRRRVALLVVGVLVVAAVAIPPGLFFDPALCDGGQERVAEVWNPQRRAEAEQAFFSTKLPYAEDTWRDVAESLDEYAASWSANHSDACQATHVRGDQSSELLDLRMMCLEQAHRELNALVDVLVQADARVLENAAKATSGLKPIGECENIEALRSDLQPPADEETRRATEQIDVEIARIKALRDAGRYQQALELALPVLERAQEVGHRPTFARAAWAAGGVHVGMGQPRLAEAELQRALLASEATGMDHLRAFVMTELVYVVGNMQAQHERALWIARAAHAVIDRIGGLPYNRAQLLANEAVVLSSQGKTAEALAKNEEALAMREAAGLGEGDGNIAGILSNIGSAHFTRGEYQRALVNYRRAHELYSGSFGPKHPINAQAIENIANALQGLGRVEEALEFHLRALGILRDSKIDQGPRYAVQLNNLAVVFDALGRKDEARQHYEQARNTWHAENPDHPLIGVVLCNLAELDAGDRKFAEALSLYENGREILAGGFGPRHLYVGVALAGKGRALVELGRAAEAIEPLRESVAIQLESPGDPLTLGEAQFHLARALEEARDGDAQRAEALEYAYQARTNLEKAGGKGEKVLAEVAVWLDQVRGP